MPLLDNLWSVVKGSVAGGLLQDDADLINTYVPPQLQNLMSDEERQRAAQQIRLVGASGLASRGVDSTERARAIQSSVLPELMTRYQQGQAAQEQSAIADYMSKLQQSQVTPEMAIGASGQAGPTQSKADMIGAPNPYAVGDAMKARAMAYRQLATQFDTANPAKAEQYRKAADQIDPPFEYAANITEMVGGKPVTAIYGKRGQRQLGGEAFNRDKEMAYTGAYANLALSMFGTNRIDQLDPNQRMALDKEAQRRQLERPASVRVDINNGEKAFETETAKFQSKLFGETMQQGMVAQRNLAQIDQLDNLLQRTGGGLGVAAKQYAGNLGIKTEGLDDIQAAGAIINQLVPAQRPAGAGTMSDRDVQLYKDSLPSLMKTPGGNQKIMSYMRGIAQYDMKIAEIANAAMTGRIDRNEALRLMNSVPNPLADLSKSLPSSPQDAARAELERRRAARGGQ